MFADGNARFVLFWEIVCSGFAMALPSTAGTAVSSGRAGVCGQFTRLYPCACARDRCSAKTVVRAGWSKVSRVDEARGPAQKSRVGGALGP